MIPDNHEFAIRYLRGTLKSIQKGKTSPNAWHGAVRWAMVLGVTADEVEQIRLGRL